MNGRSGFTLIEILVATLILAFGLLSLMVGLGNLLFAVVYALLPMLTKLEARSRTLIKVHFWGWTGGTMLMTTAMGTAGAQGMLRRMLYFAGEYHGFMVVAVIGALIAGAGFLAFLANLVWTLGLPNILSLFLPQAWVEKRWGKAPAVAS